MPILFSTDRPDFYLIDQIFSPSSNPDGEIIPRPNSLVIDPSNDNLLQTVESVNEDTMEVTYAPVLTSLLAPSPEVPISSDESAVSIVDYGNSRFYCYVDKAENPTRLLPDRKIIILGDDVKDFEIVRYDSESDTYVPISLYYDTDGIYRGTRIPLIAVSTTDNAKIPTNCHTSVDINDDDVFYMIIYDYSGTQTASIKLFAQQALVNNVADDSRIIEDFRVTATQMDSEGVYLFPDQDPLSLVINPEVVYDNGDVRSIPIDNQVCHLYGLEGFTAAYPGQQVELMVKYFLSATQQAVGDFVGALGSTRFLTKKFNLIVKNPGTNEYNIKILTVPRYLTSTDKWTLMFYLYSLESDMAINITPLVTVSPLLEGSNMLNDQMLTLSFRLRDVYPDAASDIIYQQPLVIKLAPYSYYERYIMKDSVGDTYGVYGVDSPTLARPVMYYDETISKYFIPTSKFPNIDTMLEAFYYKARPLYDNSWLSEPVRPTHFTIRDVVSGTLLLPAPVLMSAYTQSLQLTNVSSPDHLVGSNCIVEFLEFKNAEYHVLYGSPVDTYIGTFA